MRLTVKSSTGSIARGGENPESSFSGKGRLAAFLFSPYDVSGAGPGSDCFAGAVDPGAFHGDKVVSWMGMKPSTWSFISEGVHPCT